MKSLPKQFFKSILFSIALSIAANCIYYITTQKGGDINTALPSIMEGAVFLNAIIFVMTLPALFLVNPEYWNNIIVRLLLYFAGSVIFIITTLSMHLQPATKIVYLITGVVFLLVHTVFYYFLVKKKA
jgi:hypothetical protein